MYNKNDKGGDKRCCYRLYMIQCSNNILDGVSTVNITDKGWIFCWILIFFENTM